MSKRSLVTIFVWAISFCGIAQTSLYPRMILDTLCSPFMYGRGYVQKGDSIAASFLSSEFEKIGLIPFGDSYYQEYTFAVNTFPGKMQFEINHTPLIPGRDFIVSEFSPALLGHYKIYRLNNSFVNNEKKFTKRVQNGFFKDKLILQEELDEENLLIATTIESQGTIQLVNKLTWSISANVGKPLIKILEQSIPQKKKLSCAIDIEQKFTPDYKSRNVVGFIPGTVYPDSFLVFSAHYDHLGCMGKGIYFPGANDNASGVALLMNLAKFYNQNPHKYSVAFMLFSGEEAGLLGSIHYAKHPLFDLKGIVFQLNLDVVGTGGDGIKVINGSVFEEEFELLKSLNDSLQLFKGVFPRKDAANSDHYPFYKTGVKNFFIYTLGGEPPYHHIDDRPELLNLEYFEKLEDLLIQFYQSL